MQNPQIEYEEDSHTWKCQARRESHGQGKQIHLLESCRSRLPDGMRNDGSSQCLRRVLQAYGRQSGNGPRCHHDALFPLQSSHWLLHAHRVTLYCAWAQDAQHHDRCEPACARIRRSHSLGTKHARDGCSGHRARHRLCRRLDARHHALHRQLVREGQGHHHGHRALGLRHRVGHRQPHRDELHTALRVSDGVPWLRGVHPAHHSSGAPVLPSHPTRGGTYALRSR